MDVNSGRLVSDMTLLSDDERGKFTRVPAFLQAFAERELAGQQEVVVNMARRNELTRWANSVKAKNRARAKLQKASRRKNRK